VPLELSPGDWFGPFEILAEIGRGGSACVFRVRAPDHDGPAALKVSIEPTIPDMAERAMREIAVLRRLTNRHVARLYQAGQADDGRVFILMEELEGAQLDHWHDFDTPMPPGQAVWVVHQACLGLAEAHAHGIVHRDVKPENLWVELDHNVKLLDFGLARAWDAPGESISANVTTTRMMIGTPRYMQPEQFHDPRLTPASDVYSLATVLYELLSGHAVYFPDERFSVLRERLFDEPLTWLASHVRGEIVPLSRYPECADVPEALARLVYRALDRDPTRRPLDAAAFANELGAILHYDLGVTPAATLRTRLPWGGHQERLLLPGSHRIGSASDCEIALGGEGVHALHALLEWSGLPEYTEVRAFVEGAVLRVNDEPLVGRRVLHPDDELRIGDFVLSLDYPKL
jgi:serine/threonine protein kinase